MQQGELKVALLHDVEEIWKINIEKFWAILNWKSVEFLVEIKQIII